LNNGFAEKHVAGVFFGYSSIMSLSGLGVLQVEPTDHCNLNCLMCAPHRDGWEKVHRVPKGYLDPALWEKMVLEFKKSRLSFDHIIFQWLGDPLLHPELHLLVEMAAKGLAGQVNYLRIDTNAVRLDLNRAAHLVDSACGNGPPLLIVLSIDAASSGAYATVKGQDRFDLVLKNTRALLRLRHSRGERCRLNIQAQFVVQDGNAHETIPFLAYWTDLLSCYGGSWHDEVLFKRLSVDGGASGQAAADQLYERSVGGAGIVPGQIKAVDVLTWSQRPWQQDDRHDVKRTACPGLWMTPVISHNGELMMCCADLKGELSLGSLHHHSFSELWFGPKAASYRRAHLEGRFEGVCAGCGGMNWYSLTAQNIGEMQRLEADQLEGKYRST